ncbi:MAG TPA: BMP family ABC transporter substrate-binding protein [Bacillota bacterium]|nr:BMP family ABC transporter substrate-binding protein [Bacillota bacterium]
MNVRRFITVLTDRFLPAKCGVEHGRSGARTRQAAPGAWALLGLVLALSAIPFQTAFAQFKVGLVLDRGGKDDKSFNSSAYEAVMQAKNKLGASVKYVEATDDNAFEPLMRAMAQRNFDLIIGVGFAQKEAIGKVAAQFPKIHFAIVDAEVNAPNVRSLMFQEHEGAYVVGAIAALTSKTGKIGFVGGMDIPLIRRFALGYEAGAKHVNPQATVLVNFVGVTGEAWNNPPKGKELAVSQYDQGADIVFAAAGASGLGVFDAAEDKRKFVIGVDANQNWVKPGLVLTSMLKRVDQAVYSTVEEAKAGQFTGGTKRYGLANKGIDYSFDQHNQTILTEAVRKKADELKAQIVAGNIAVPDYYQKKP